MRRRDDLSAYYLTEDPEQVQAVIEAFDAAAAWGRRVRALAEELGRQAVTTQSSLVGFTLRDGEPLRKADWVGTEWVLEFSRRGEVDAYLRPRADKKGAELRERMDALGKSPDPREPLIGIPKRTGRFGFGRPGIMLNADRTAVALQYPEVLTDYDRSLWREIRASEWYAILEEREAREPEAAAS